jgi:hypothetical protein
MEHMNGLRLELTPPRRYTEARPAAAPRSCAAARTGVRDA